MRPNANGVGPFFMPENSLSNLKQEDWFETPIQFAKGVGPRLSPLLGKLGIHSFEDMLFHIPFRYLDRRELQALNLIQASKNAAIMAQVQASGEVSLGRRGKRIWEVVFTDGRGHLVAKWFRFNRAYMTKRFQKGKHYILFGETSLYKGQWQMVHPEVHSINEFSDEEPAHQILGFIPVYRSTEGLHQKTLARILKGLLKEFERVGLETLPEELMSRNQFPSFTSSLKALHEPPKEANVLELEQHRSIWHQRLAFEEFFYLQLGLSLKRIRSHHSEGVAHHPHVKLKNRFLKSLPFELTGSQVRAVTSIAEKMVLAEPMNVLLQGDVGSGKTIVGLLAALLAVENEHQAAIMAPTEILAEQHLRVFEKFVSPLGVKVRLLTASTPSGERETTLEELNRGDPMIVIGTHALLEGPVNFQNLSLVLVDEQHRFGVRQRMTLMKKGHRPDVLVMTATPIPRSLAMTLYGDLDLLIIDELPAGRQPITTRIMYEKNRPDLYTFVRKKIQEGRQAYFVFPLIEESEKMDLKDATQAYERLTEIFSDFSVGMIHGRMKGDEKDKIMRAFADGEIQILVATTVIEVGIDVPNATLMVIEHAERFGLSQLHQLRGRVGRGREKSYCVLACSFPASDLAKLRLKVMTEYQDGFKIAEEDLKIRGPGDFLGTRQSGMPELRIANLIQDLPLLELAREEARLLLAADPDLLQERHMTIRQVLRRRWGGKLGLASVG